MSSIKFLRCRNQFKSSINYVLKLGEINNKSYYQRSHHKVLRLGHNVWAEKNKLHKMVVEECNTKQKMYSFKIENISFTVYVDS